VVEHDGQLQLSVGGLCRPDDEGAGLGVGVRAPSGVAAHLGVGGEVVNGVVVRVFESSQRQPLSGDCCNA
jgi:hypothetical protein